MNLNRSSHDGLSLDIDPDASTATPPILVRRRGRPFMRLYLYGNAPIAANQQATNDDT